MEWACAACTFLNSPSNGECSACGTTCIAGSRNSVSRGAVAETGTRHVADIDRGAGGPYCPSTCLRVASSAGRENPVIPSPHGWYNCRIDTSIWRDPRANANSLSWEQLFDPEWRHVPLSVSIQHRTEVLTHALVSSYGHDIRIFLAPLLNLDDVHVVLVDQGPKPGTAGSERATPGVQKNWPPANWQGQIGMDAAEKAAARGTLTVVYPPMSQRNFSSSGGSRGVGGSGSDHWAGYGTMHAKLVVLRFGERTSRSGACSGISTASSALRTSRVRVVVSSSNALCDDYTRTSQSLWVQDFYLHGADPAIDSTGYSMSGSSSIMCTQGGGERNSCQADTLYVSPTFSDFGSQLVTFLERWLVPKEYIELLTMGVDFSGATADLVAAVPGSHYPKIPSSQSNAGKGLGEKRSAAEAGHESEAGREVSAKTAAGSAYSPSIRQHGSIKEQVLAELVQQGCDYSLPLFSYGHMRLRFLRSYQRVMQVALFNRLHSLVANSAAAHIPKEPLPMIGMVASSVGSGVTSSYLAELYVSACGVPTRSADPTVCEKAACEGGAPYEPGFRVAMQGIIEPSATRAVSSSSVQAGEPCKMSIVFPSASTVLSALYPQSEKDLHMSRSAWNKPKFPRHAFSRWQIRSTWPQRNGLLTHQKIIFPVSPPPLPPTVNEACAIASVNAAPKAVVITRERDWCLVGSANASMPAWGKLESAHQLWGPVLRIESWEMGVLFPPVLRIQIGPNVTLRERELVMAELRGIGRVFDHAPLPHPFPFNPQPIRYTSPDLDTPFMRDIPWVGH